MLRNDMSSFICPQCGKEIIDSVGEGYITECEHYPMIYHNAGEEGGNIFRIPLRRATKTDTGNNNVETKMGTKKYCFKKKMPAKKAREQEKKSARELLGRQTYGSGNLPFDKADIFIKKGLVNFEPKEMRIECKRTDNKSITIEKEWIDKLKRETKPKEFWALEIEIQDEQIFCISKDDFKFLSWMLTHSWEDIKTLLGEE
jgi:hypothetical protein